MQFTVVDGFQIDQLGVETVITCPGGDIVVLNETAGELFSCFLGGASHSDAVEYLISKYELTNEVANNDVTELLNNLLSAGVIARSKELSECLSTSAGYAFSKPADISFDRRIFVAGALALGASLLVPSLALGKETAALADNLFNGRQLSAVDDRPNNTRTWTDSLGRQVKVPTNITTVAPFGAYAQAMLESINPDSVVSICKRGLRASFASQNGTPKLIKSAQKMAARQDMSIDKTMLATYEPDVIISIENSASRTEPLRQSFTETNGVPIVHIIASLEEIPQTFRTLGDFLNEERAYELADFTAQILLTFAQGRELITDENRKSVYFGAGTLGFDTRGKGSQIGSILEMIGARNVAHDLIGEECLNVSFGRITNWIPDLAVLVIPDLTEDSERFNIVEGVWQRSGYFPTTDVRIAPTDPFSWFDFSPLTTQTLSALWLAKLLYPEIYSYNLNQTVSNYFKLFFHRELSEFQAKDLLESTKLVAESRQIW